MAQVDHDNIRDLHERFKDAHNRKDEEHCAAIVNTIIHEAAVHSDAEVSLPLSPASFCPFTDSSASLFALNRKCRCTS